MRSRVVSQHRPQKVQASGTNAEGKRQNARKKSTVSVPSISPADHAKDF
jgi:hypothetical protein